VLTTLAPAKVNLCLLVGRPRPDGLHPIVSLVQPVALADELTLEARGDASPLADEVVCPGVTGENLAARALADFRAATGWAAAAQRLTIAKRIPVAAGMAGGSADAAAALRLAAAASGLPIPPGLAMALGADVPVMLAATRALVIGAGEHVEPLAPEAIGTLVIVPLDAELSAGAVYRAFDELGAVRGDDELAVAAGALRAGGSLPDALAVNDLEPAARALCPAIEPALAALRAAGATRVMVTGSGPTVFGSGDEAVAERVRRAGFPRAVAVGAAGPHDAGVLRA
jgi:4-diphosphocytidyl-2-C-methyl-D-erythritol kinase